MRHERATDEIREQTALHALGLLEPDQARSFQDHATGCPVCESERRAFEAAAARLPLALPQSQPAPSLRERLLARIRAKPELPAGLHVVRSEHGAWQSAGFPGVSVKQLYVDAQENVTVLVRMEPGARYPGHRHVAAEQCLVLEGDLRIGDLVLHAGDFQRADAASEHQVSSTEQGCLLLVIASQHNELII